MGDTGHHSAVQEDAKTLGRIRYDPSLDSVKRNQIEPRSELIGSKPADNFPSHAGRRTVRRRRIAEEMSEGNMAPPPHHFVRSHGRIESPGEKRNQPAAGGGRKPAGAVVPVHIEEGRSRNDLNVTSRLRDTQVDLYTGIGSAQAVKHCLPEV